MTNKYYYIGIDPGLPFVGIAIYPYRKKVNSFSKKHLKLKLLETSLKCDDISRFRKLREYFDEFFNKYPPAMVFIEDVDFRPTIPRESQAKLYASMTTILTSLSPEYGYLRVNKIQAKKVLGLMTRSGRVLSKKDTHERILRSYPFLESYVKKYKSKYEHMFDAFVILKAGVHLLETGQARL